MGVSSSKSPLERRNTVLRRSQRKSIHGIKSKAEKIAKEIKKFKGTEENSDYIDLKAKIESAERELKLQAKNLQPQIRIIHNEALKKTELCYKLLDDKLKENQEKIKVKEEKQGKQPQEHEAKEIDDNDDVFVEETNEEQKQEEEKRKTVELTLVQVEPIEGSPQINKRFSAMKIGVPVMPGSMMESLNRKTKEININAHDRVANIRKEIEQIETEISQFVGKKNGKYYNKIKRQLDGYGDELKTISSEDEDVLEQIMMCAQYIGSCLSFLDERACDKDEEDDDYDDLPPPRKVEVVDSNLSPRTMRTTYI